MILLNQKKNDSPLVWYLEMRAQGYSVPVQMMAGISRLMKKNGMTFEEAYDFLVERRKIILTGKTFIYDLTADYL